MRLQRVDLHHLRLLRIRDFVAVAVVLLAFVGEGVDVSRVDDV
jgi:hypothetical protein